MRSSSAWPTTCTTRCCPTPGSRGDVLGPYLEPVLERLTERELATLLDALAQRVRELLTYRADADHARRSGLPRRGRARPRAAVPPPRAGGGFHRGAGARGPGAGARRSGGRLPPRGAGRGGPMTSASVVCGAARACVPLHADTRSTLHDGEAPLAVVAGIPWLAGRTRRRAGSGPSPRSTPATPTARRWCCWPTPTTGGRPAAAGCSAARRAGGNDPARRRRPARVRPGRAPTSCIGGPTRALAGRAGPDRGAPARGPSGRRPRLRRRTPACATWRCTATVI